MTNKTINLMPGETLTAREAWMREFREHVAQFVAGTANTDHVTAGTRAAGEVHADGDARATRLVIGELVENLRATQSSASAVRLLIAEKGAQYAEFVEVMNRLARSGLGLREALPAICSGRTGSRIAPEGVAERSLGLPTGVAGCPAADRVRIAPSGSW